MLAMPLATGTHALGPPDAELLVCTSRSGAAAKAGHDLIIEVTSWSATLEIAEEPGRGAAALTADGGSLRVREGRGGIQTLGDDDKAGIEKTIDQEILKRAAIEFRSTAVQAGSEGEPIRVHGELELLGRRRPVDFELSVTEEGRLTGSATVKQSDWGIKPYSILFGTIKVADEVVVTIEGNLSSYSR